jgi:two-component system, sensor histidine kinase
VPNAAAVESAQLEPMVRNSSVGAASALVGGGIMIGAVAYEDGFLSLGLALWYGLLAVTYAGQVGLAFMLRRRASPGLSTRTGLALFTAIGLAEGVVWSIGIVGVSATRPIEQELTVLLIGAGVAAGAALSFGFHMPTFLCRFLGATVPYVFWAILQGNELHLMLALTVFVYSISSIQMTLGFNRSFILSTRLTLENQDLVRELRVQKEAAELANVAKSKFIATASHDLRQPVHALGLLAGALQGHAMNDDMRRLVGQIGGSVTAMDGLFDSLLDISRLDAGVVETQIEDFPIQPVLERVCRDYLAEAETKGLRLVWNRCSAMCAPIRSSWSVSWEILFPMPFAIPIAAASSWVVVAGTGFASRCGIRAGASRWGNKARSSVSSFSWRPLSATAQRGLVSGSRLSTGSRSCSTALSPCAPNLGRGLCS